MRLFRRARGGRISSRGKDDDRVPAVLSEGGYVPKATHLPTRSLPNCTVCGSPRVEINGEPDHIIPASVIRAFGVEPEMRRIGEAHGEERP